MNWNVIPLLTFACDQKTIFEFEREWVKATTAGLNTYSPATNQKQYRAEYYKENKDAIKQYQAAYYKENKYNKKQYQTGYYKENIGKKNGITVKYVTLHVCLIMI